jgi:hypothetical protein
MSAVKGLRLNLNPFQNAVSGSIQADDIEDTDASTFDKVFRSIPLTEEFFSPEAFDELSVGDLGSNTSQVYSSPSRKWQRLTHFLPKGVVRSRFMELQQWEGVVTEVTQEAFFARLLSLSDNKSDLEAEFAIDEVHREDKKLIHPGAIFYWSIGYKEDRGQRIRASLVRFRRLPAWQKHELEAARKDATGFADLFEWK